MPKQSFIKLGFLLLISAFLLNSCYTPNNFAAERIAPRVNARNEIIRKYVKADLKIGQRYIDYGFANERIIKPKSFRRLDSLYAAYHEEEIKAGASKNKLLNLKNEIEQEKQVVLKDTIHFLYEQPHFFGISSGDTTTIMFADFTVNSNNEIVKVNINYMFDTPSRNTQFYQAYLLKESFVDFGFAPSQEESQFYNFFDAMLNSIEDSDRKGIFLEHILQIMRAANQQQGMNTERLIKQHVINTVTHGVKTYKPLNWSRVYTVLDEKDVLKFYELDHHWSYSDSNGVRHELKRQFVLNAYFEVVEVSEITAIRN